MSYTNLFGKRRSSRVSAKNGPTEYGKMMCFTLNVVTDRPRVETSLIMNRVESPESRIVSISANEPTLYIRGEHVPLDLSEVAFVGKELTLRSGWNTTTKTFLSDHGAFTVKELMNCIVEFELEDRPKTTWAGGVDCHHIFFEGLLHVQDKEYQISWGS